MIDGMGFVSHRLRNSLIRGSLIDGSNDPLTQMEAAERASRSVLPHFSLLSFEF